MSVLNLAVENKALYKGCKVTEFEPGRFRLETALDSAVVIVAENIREFLKGIPESERECLVVTGAAPSVFYMTAVSILGRHFQRIEHFDGKSRRTTIPRAPDREE